eukprot:TRINITY_DN32352_c0_g1_i1.p1 TRINITY_DN32352_c0_g1~~TRINITY_DN32352_c0_g1_i1.p1  ORF type:complete len:252 (+),score=40.64 TRINITY_DN32352_c0_g1_i1:42-797(+)
MQKHLLPLLLKMLADSAASLESRTLLGDDGLRAILSDTSRNVLHVEFAQSHNKADDAEDTLRPLDWHDASSLLVGESPAFRSLLSKVLADAPFDAFYWECAPISRATVRQRIFEFVIADAPHLSHMEPDSQSFREHLGRFEGQATSRTFFNLGGDSALVSPAQSGGSAEDYKHIANFFRRTTQAQQHAQWQELGSALLDRLKGLAPTTHVWVSTEGSGVAWVHMRLDPRPKYYHHAPYRSPEYGLGRQSEL